MKNYKVYGSEPTHITLSKKAQAFYDSTDPLEIREFCRYVEDENGEEEKVYTYDVIGAVERYGMTAEELNDFLEG